jgi:hypothetical protein
LNYQGNVLSGWKLVVPRGEKLRIICRAGASGGKYTMPSYSGRLELTAICPRGTEVIPANWEMEMRDDARDHLSDPATVTLKIDNGAPLGEQAMEFRAKRTDGQVVTQKLEMQVVDLLPTSLSGTIATAKSAYSQPDDLDGQIAFCSLELVDTPTVLGLVGAGNDVALSIDRQTKIEKVVADQRVAASVADLKTGASLRWDFRALLLSPAEINNPGASSGHVAVARSIVIQPDGK